jgi:hypothetical protein
MHASTHTVPRSFLIFRWANKTSLLVIARQVQSKTEIQQTNCNQLLEKCHKNSSYLVVGNMSADIEGATVCASIEKRVCFVCICVRFDAVDWSSGHAIEAASTFVYFSVQYWLQYE